MLDYWYRATTKSQDSWAFFIVLRPSSKLVVLIRPFVDFPFGLVDDESKVVGIEGKLTFLANISSKLESNASLTLSS